jgi:flagellar basal body-associated protein FliL
MSDEEQIRLLTEIRDVLKEQTAWAREATKKRGRVTIIVMAILFAFLAYFTYITVWSRNRDQNEGQEQTQPRSVDVRPLA